MAIENVRPTRLELLRTRRRIQVAKRGAPAAQAQAYRADAGVLRHLSAGAGVAGGPATEGGPRVQVVSGWPRCYEGPVRLENVSTLLPQIHPIKVATKNVMGVKTPRVDGTACTRRSRRRNCSTFRLRSTSRSATSRGSTRSCSISPRRRMRCAGSSRRSSGRSAGPTPSRTSSYPAREHGALHQVPIRRDGTRRLQHAQVRETQD